MASVLLPPNNRRKSFLLAMQELMLSGYTRKPNQSGNSILIIETSDTVRYGLLDATISELHALDTDPCGRRPRDVR